MGDVTFRTVALAAVLLVALFFFGEYTGFAVVDTTNDLIFDDEDLLEDNISKEFKLNKELFLSLFEDFPEKRSPEKTDSTVDETNNTTDVNTSTTDTLNASLSNQTDTSTDGTTLNNTSTSDTIILGNVSNTTTIQSNSSTTASIVVDNKAADNDTSVVRKDVVENPEVTKEDSDKEEVFEEDDVLTETFVKSDDVWVIDQPVEKESLNRIKEKRKTARKEHKLAKKNLVVKKAYEPLLVERFNPETDAFETEEKGTKFTVEVEIVKPLYDVRIYEDIPKSVAAHVDEIVFVGLQPEVVEEDPLVVWHFPQVDESVELSYHVEKQRDEITELPETIELVGAIEQRSPGKFPLFKGIGMMLALFFGASIFIISHVERKE